MVACHILALCLATLVGVSLGALGGGGSIITTPILVYVEHVRPDHAVGMSLVIVGVTSFIGASLHLRRGNVALKSGLLFALTGMAGSYIGSTGTHLISRRVLMLIYSGIMLVVGYAMLRRRTTKPDSSKPANAYLCLIAGFFVGLLTGFLGVGGGFLIVPFLVLFGGLDIRLAAGTSLAVIAFNSITGVLGQLRFAPIDWNIAMGFLVFSLAGMVVGSSVSARLPAASLRRIFGTAVLILGATVGLINLL